MDKNDVIAFFDSLAADWDAGMVKDEEVIERILDNVCVRQGKTVLDVACGTGVMIPYYLERGASFITAIDISPKMCEIASDKFRNENVKIICDDVVEHDFKEKFDCILVYNAFPHFDDPEALIKKLSELLNDGGMLSVAHGMSREKILAHHENVKHVSKALPEVEELKRLFEKYLSVTVSIFDQRMYQVVGRKS